MLESSKRDLGILTSDYSGATFESVFLTLNEEHQFQREAELRREKEEEKKQVKSKRGWLGIGRKSEKGAVVSSVSDDSSSDEKEQREEDIYNEGTTLTDGKPVGLLPLAWAQFRKRIVVFRRSFMAPILTILVAVIGSIVPLAFISDRDASCERGFSDSEFSLPLTLSSPYVNVAPVIFSPESTFEDVLGNSLPSTINTFARAGSIPISSLVQQVPQIAFDQVIRRVYCKCFIATLYF